MERPLGQLAALDYGSEADAARFARGRVSSSASRRRSILARTVELDVIPRLVLARREASSLLPVAGVNAVQIAELATLALADTESRAAAFVVALREQGVAPEALYLDLLAPAARRLGELWLDDECDFTEVTIGLWRLQNAMRQISPDFLRAGAMAAGETTPRVLLVPLSGEQHTFGLSMVFDFFRRAGWNAWSGPIASIGELATMVASEWVDVVGFSLACDERLETARSEIQAVRRASRNPGVAVMVGGPPFIMDRGLAAEIGADGTAMDGLQAVTAAKALLRTQPERR